MKATTYLAAGLIVLTLNSALPGQSDLKKFESAITKILCVRNDGSRHSASGFCFRHHSYVVAALHSVTNCRSIAVTFRTKAKRTTRRATIIRALRSDDLALLKLNQAAPAEVTPLKVATSNVRAGQTITAVGYALNASSPVDYEMKVRKLKAICDLSECVPPNVMSEINQLPVLTARTKVVNIQGTLLPGHSGGPLFNAMTEVVAIANGGVNRGANAWSWAIPASRLQALLRSRERQPPAWPKKGDILFGNDLGRTHVPPPQIGRPIPRVRALKTNIGLFHPVGVVSLAQIRQIKFFNRNQDPHALEILIGDMARRNPAVVRPQVLNKMQFQIFRHVQTGAKLVLPLGAKIERPIQLVPRVGRPMEVVRATLRKTQLAFFATPFISNTDIRPMHNLTMAFEQRVTKWNPTIRWTIDLRRSNRLFPVSNFPVPVVAPPLAPGDIAAAFYRRSQYHARLRAGQVPRPGDAGYHSSMYVIKGPILLGGMAHVGPPPQGRLGQQYYVDWFHSLLAAHLIGFR